MACPGAPQEVTGSKATGLRVSFKDPRPGAEAEVVGAMSQPAPGQLGDDLSWIYILTKGRPSENTGAGRWGWARGHVWFKPSLTRML